MVPLCASWHPSLPFLHALRFYLLRPICFVLSQPRKSTLKLLRAHKRNHWYSSGTSTNVSSNLRPSSAPETTTVVIRDNKHPVEETSVTETTSLDVKLDD